MRTDRTSPPRRRAPRGSSLVEALAAMAVMLTGAAGLASLNTMSIRYDADGRRITRATAIAEDLAAQIAQWPYADTRLTNDNTSNDQTIGDPGFLLQGASDPTSYIDHGEADLTKGGTTFFGIPTGDAALSGFERYWNVSFDDPGNPGNLLDYNGNGVADGMRVAVIVRWQVGGGWRRVVLIVNKANPGDRR